MLVSLRGQIIKYCYQNNLSKITEEGSNLFSIKGSP